MQKVHFRLTSVAQQRCCLSSLLFRGRGGGEFKQTRRKATWNVSTGSKQLTIAKRKVELKEKKNIKMWSWKKKMCLARFYLEKNQKNAIGVQLQISFPKQTYIFSPDTSCLRYSIKCQTRGIPEVICAQRHTTTYVSRRNSRWVFDLSCRAIP